MSKASDILTGSASAPLVILQWSPEQTALPLLRSALASSISRSGKSSFTILICLLHPPSSLLPEKLLGEPNIGVVDLTSAVPGYSSTKPVDAIHSQFLELIDKRDGHLTAIIDCVDTLLEDVGSLTDVFLLLKLIFNQVKTRLSGTLFLTLQTSCRLRQHIESTSFSPTLQRILVYNPAIVTHIAKNFLALPPPSDSEDKFWRVLMPMTESSEYTKLVFGPSGAGTGQVECVLDVLERWVDKKQSGSHNVSRALEGWCSSGPCEIRSLRLLGPILERSAAEKIMANQPHDVSFHLPLTTSQKAARSQVPLPYLHKEIPKSGGSITYDPDSADDFDDEDPDEDLDI